MRRFLLYVHTGRPAALRAMLTVLEELRQRGVRAVVVDEQAEEILALPEDMAPPKLITFLTNGAVDVRAAVCAGDDVELGIVLGGDGTILRANANFLRTLGYEGEDVAGRPHSIFMPEGEAGSPEYASFWAELRAGRFQSREFRRRHARARRLPSAARRAEQVQFP